MRLHWANALGLSLQKILRGTGFTSVTGASSITLGLHCPCHPKTLKFRIMNGLFFAFAVIVLLANLAGGYVESMSNEKVKK